MSKKSGIFARLLAAFGLFAVGLALIMGAAAYFAAGDLAHDLLAKQSGLLLETLIQAEKQARYKSDSTVATEKMVAAFGLSFLVGKQIEPALARLPDGLHALGSEQFIFIRRLDGIAYALRGSFGLREIITRVGSMFLFCSLFGIAAAALLALAIATHLARPLQRLAGSLERADPVEKITPDLCGRSDEIGLLANTIRNYQERTAEFMERERFFTAAASHELRTPLTVLGQGLELLMVQTSANNRAATMERLERTCAGMSNTVAALLSLARAEAAPLQNLDIREIIFRIIPDLASDPHCAGLQDQGGQQRIKLGHGAAIQIGGNVWPAKGQAELATAVFRNLLENALRFSSGEAIALDLNQDRITIRNKASFTADMQARSGLGLQIAERACSRMGWRLERSGTADETVFTVILAPSRMDAGATV